MPYSERDEMPESWVKGRIETDPNNILQVGDHVNNGYFLHWCGMSYYGTLTPQVKHEDSNWSCSNCQAIVSPQLMMAVRLAK